MNTKEIEKLYNAVCIVRDFADETFVSGTRWEDFEGKEHTADAGYVTEYLDAVYKYLKKKVAANGKQS